MPAIYSPEMAMAGFGMLGDIVPAINYVARLDGATQYWQLSEDITIPESTPFRIKIQAELDRDNTRHVFSNYKADDFRLISVSQLSAAQLFVGGNSGFYSNLNPSEVVSTVEVVGDGSSYVVIIDGAAASSALQVGVITFNSIGGKWGATTNAMIGLGVHSNLSVEINHALTHEIPLTNKAQGATQLATVGNVNATMVNYTEAVWEEV